MGCNCGKRREIGGRMVSAFRRGDYTALNREGRAMAQSMREDATQMLRVKPSSLFSAANPRNHDHGQRQR